jgi:hypothetical protein
MRKYANDLYNFRGLEHFRTKMFPEAWEPIYVISNKRCFPLRSLLAAAEAFSGIAVWNFAFLVFARLARRRIDQLIRFDRDNRSPFV